MYVVESGRNLKASEDKSHLLEDGKAKLVRSKPTLSPNVLVLWKFVAMPNLNHVPAKLTWTNWIPHCGNVPLWSIAELGINIDIVSSCNYFDWWWSGLYWTSSNVDAKNDRFLRMAQKAQGLLYVFCKWTCCMYFVFI